METQTQEIKKGQIEKGFFRASVSPSSWDDKERTMDVVFTTGAKGLRRTFFGDYYEELSTESKAVRLDRLNSGAPLLADHDAVLDKVIGIVEKAKMEDGKGIATVRFANDEFSSTVVEKIRDGIISKLSVGYLVYEYEEMAAPEGEPPTFRAIDWEPFEISFVAIPFDNGAQVRQGLEKVECKLVKLNRGDKMDKRELEGEEVKPVVESVKEEEPKEPVVTLSEEKVEEPVKEEEKTEEVKAEERKRAALIIRSVKVAGLDEEVALKLIEEGKSFEHAQEEINKRWAEKGSPAMNGKVEIKELGGLESLTRGVKNALEHRAIPKTELTEEGRQYRGMSLGRIAEKFVRAAGYNTDNMSDYEIAAKVLTPECRNRFEEFKTRAGAHGTSDFTNILMDAANKTLLNAYVETPQTFRPFTRPTTTRDFKNVNRLRFGEAPSLSLIPENGEMTYGSITDSKEYYALKTHGKALKITRQALINDDTDAFARIPALMGAAASRLESDTVYGILTANAAMLNDSIALFHSSHGNLGTTGVISETTLSEMRKLGRKQTGLASTTILNLVYKYLIVPAALEIVALKNVAPIVPALSTSVNMFTGQFQVVVEPRLDANSATAWYAACDYAQIDGLEMLTLEGFSGPRIDSEIEFETQAMKMSVLHDFAAKAVDYRGLFKNAGA